ncbi:MAG: SRPBCC domain-containing protein [Planctomycetota bacterium]
MKTQTIEIRRRVAASSDKLFGAWTGAEALRQWMCGPDTDVARVQVDARSGGTLSLDLRALAGGEIFEHVGRYSAVERPARLAFTWTSEATGGAETIVTVSLEKHGACTELALTHAGLPSEAAARYHAAAWTAMIERLAVRGESASSAKVARSRQNKERDRRRIVEIRRGSSDAGLARTGRFRAE